MEIALLIGAKNLLNAPWFNKALTTIDYMKLIDYIIPNDIVSDNDTEEVEKVLISMKDFIEKWDKGGYFYTPSGYYNDSDEVFEAGIHYMRLLYKYCAVTKKDYIKEHWDSLGDGFSEIIHNKIISRKIRISDCDFGNYSICFRLNLDLNKINDNDDVAPTIRIASDFAKYFKGENCPYFIGLIALSDAFDLSDEDPNFNVVWWNFDDCIMSHDEIKEMLREFDEISIKIKKEMGLKDPGEVKFWDMDFEIWGEELVDDCNKEVDE